MADITMPQLGETVTEGTITRWLKQVGDPVAEDEVLFEVSTDKVDSEVPSPAAGVLSEILVNEGDTVDVGTRLAVVSDGAAASASSEGGAQGGADSDESGSGDAEATDSEPPAESAPEPAPEPEPEASPEPEPAPSTGSSAPAPAAPSAARAAGRNGSGGSSATKPFDGGGRVLSPVVRRLITEHDLDPAGIEGSGAGGRITRSDVLAIIDKQSNGVSAPSAPATSAPAAAAPAARSGGNGAAPAAPAATGEGVGILPFPPVAPGERDTVIPFTNIHRRTAEHMVRSKLTSAHTMVAVEVDYVGVDRVRTAERASFKEAEGFSLTYLPFISRAVVDVLHDFPRVNSSVGEDSLVVHQDIGLGIAVNLDFEGLLVPVIHQADGLRLRQVAREISGLASRAKAKKLTMDDLQGGTITLTNAGPFGTFITVPVINQPQVAIVSTDGVKKKPVVITLPDGSDGLAIHPVGNLVMSWDHRAFDGAYAAAFLARVKEVIETRDWAGEL